MGKGPLGFQTTAKAILANTVTKDVVKCFLTTGFNNMENPIYHGETIDLFLSGHSQRGKEATIQLLNDAGFGE